MTANNAVSLPCHPVPGLLPSVSALQEQKRIIWNPMAGEACALGVPSPCPSHIVAFKDMKKFKAEVRDTDGAKAFSEKVMKRIISQPVTAIYQVNFRSSLKWLIRPSQASACHSASQFLCLLYPFFLFFQTFSHPIIPPLLAFQPLLLAPFLFGETRPQSFRSHLGLLQQLSKNSVHLSFYRLETYYEFSTVHVTGKRLVLFPETYL